MSLITRIILMLMLPLTADALSAQPASASAKTTTTATTETETASAEPAGAAIETGYDIRNEFGTLLRQHPPELTTILRLDPTLLSNEPFLASYPQLSKFVAAHPEVRRNPRFYLGDFEIDNGRNRTLEDILQGLFIFGMISLFAFIFGWFIRTVIEQRRWSRLSRTQTEVHGKILDRFGTSSELLEYMKTPAGSKFLESAPIPLHPEAPRPNAALSRVLWSIQVGVIVGAAAIGMLLISGRFEKETAQGLFALGMIALSIGIGFVGSAAISLFVSRRLGLWQAPPTSEAVESGLVR